ncbi:Tim44/TimA family putative adaptor protein [Elstera sp.]|uniref:Tim44/TimA family putative adaptor protein n=1 Tax=Elstera sp. TaxID=1916664 RepID=UPI0037BF4944
MPVLESIVLFAVIAAFLLYRLLSVLGQRTGEERQQPNPLERSAEPVRPDQGPVPGKILPFPIPSQRAEPRPVDEPRSLAEGIEELGQFDPNFEEVGFVGGARAAYEMIVKAYAEGDTGTLRPLLTDSVFGDFNTAIQQRGGPEPVALVRIVAADLADVRMDGPIALVTVRFAAEQADGGEITDLWTFRRDVRSKDPNWLLSQTRAGGA